MNGSLLLWSLVALVVFWCVGLYNRLMRMRARGLDTLGSVERLLRNYLSLVDTHLVARGAAAQPGDGEDRTVNLPARWTQLVARLHHMDVVMNAVRNAPLAVQPMARLDDAIGAVQQAWAQLRDQPLDLAGPAVPDAMQLRWDANTLQVHVALRQLNKILTEYNEAIAQFPAALVVGLMRLEPVGSLRENHDTH